MPSLKVGHSRKGTKSSAGGNTKYGSRRHSISVCLNSTHDSAGDTLDRFPRELDPTIVLAVSDPTRCCLPCLKFSLASRQKLAEHIIFLSSFDFPTTEGNGLLRRYIDCQPLKMIATLITRIFQIIFGIIVLALSIDAIKWQVYGSAPATTGYGAFTGAFCILIGLIGCVAIFVEALPGLIVAAADGLAAILLLAGGIAFAVQIRGVNCGKSDEDVLSMGLNFLMNGGCRGKGDDETCGFAADADSTADALSTLLSHCHTVEADTAFLFLGFVACIGAAVLCLMAGRRGGARHSAV
nr:hypothetical protein CFP56_32301 [Quercus suber]